MNSRSAQPRSIWTAALPGLFLGVIGSAALWLVAKDTLGLWLGGLAIVALLLPPLSATERGWVGRVIAGGVVADCVMVLWLLSAGWSEVTIGQWFHCSVVLYAFAICGLGLILMLREAGIPGELTAAVTVLALLGWLTAPVWPAGWVDPPVAGVLSRFHPLLAINGQIPQLGIWLEQPIVYRVAVLGQDVPYSLPGDVWWSAGAHAGLGVVFAGVGLMAGRSGETGGPGAADHPPRDPGGERAEPATPAGSSGPRFRCSRWRVFRGFGPSLRGADRRQSGRSSFSWKGCQLC
ncbi:MAG: hypothetical protein RMJ35_02570 [Phycisphaerales bacterium]|nr:hypothetical protein [Phycisphaerales bacterium]